MAIGIGLELSPSAVRAVILERSGGSASHLGSVKFVAGLDVPCDTANPEALTRALIQVRSVLRIRQPVVLGVPKTWAILTTVHPLVVNPRRATLAVQFELQQQLPFDLLDAAWHYQWLSSQGNGVTATKRWRSSSGHQQSGVLPTPSRLSSGMPTSSLSSAAMVAAMRWSMLEERLAACRRAGLTIKAVSITPVALLNVWQAQRSPSMMSAPVALLHLVTDQIAEWILWTPAALQIASVSSVSPDALWSDLTASWNALQAHVKEVLRRVIVIGPAIAFPRAQEALSVVPTVSIERWDLKQVVTADEAKAALLEQSMAAVGLAFQDLGIAQIPLNLVASTQREESVRHVRQLASMMSGVCALVAVGFGLSGMRDLHHRRSRVLESLRNQERLYQTLRPNVRSLLKSQQHRQQQIEQLARLVREGPLMTQLLAQVAEALPDDVWLTKVEWTKTDGVTGLFEGRAKTFQDVTVFFDRLKSVAGMTSIKPLSTNVMADQASGKELIAFSVQIQRSMDRSSAATTESSSSAPAQTGTAIVETGRTTSTADRRRPRE